MTSKSENPAAPAPQGRKLPLGMILGGLLTVLLIVTVFLTLDGGEAAADEYGDPTITGSLATLIDPATDAAIDTPAPEVVGAGFDAAEVSITNDGNAKIILFLAHWCPHCQNEVPWVTEWLNDGNLPDNVDFYSVATSIDRSRENWPPSDWLEREDWPAPVIVDDQADSVTGAFGLSAYPFWVFVNADGTIAGRVSGGLSVTTLDGVAATLSGS